MIGVKNSNARYRVLAMLCLSAVIAYICRNSVSVAESTIRQDLGLTKSQSGWMMSIFFLAYGIGQVPSSILSIRVGSRVALFAVACAWSLATGAMSLALTVPMLLWSRTLNGVAQAGIFPNTTAVVARWFPKTQRGIASGFIASSMSIGGAVGAAATGYLLLFVSWRMAFALFSVLGIIWGAVFYVWFRNDPADHPEVSPNELDLIQSGQEKSDDSDEVEKTPWRRILLSPATFWISAQQFFRAAGYIFFASWFATYLQEARGVTRSTSGLLNSLPLLSVVVGAWFGGILSDAILRRTGSIRVARKGMATVCMLICAVFTLIAFFIKDPVWASITISIGTLCASVGGPCAYTITIDLGGKHVSALFAVMNMVGNLGAFGFIQGVALFLDWSDANKWGNFGWNAVFVGFAMMYLLAAFCWFMLRTDELAADQTFTRKKTSKT